MFSTLLKTLSPNSVPWNLCLQAVTSVLGKKFLKADALHSLLPSGFQATMVACKFDTPTFLTVSLFGSYLQMFNMIVVCRHSAHRLVGLCSM